MKKILSGVVIIAAGVIVMIFTPMTYFALGIGLTSIGFMVIFSHLVSVLNDGSPGN